VPLFADQVEIQTRDASAWVEGSRLSGEEQLQARHNDAMRATSLREAVCKLVTSDEYGKLLTARERYPGSGTYGVIFWRKQLDHIERVGGPDIFIPKPTLTAKLSFPWLKPDAELTWASAPGGAKRIRVLFIGSDLVLTRLVGEPFIDFDPRLIPNQNNWIKPNDFEEAGEVVTQPAAATFYPATRIGESLCRAMKLRNSPVSLSGCSRAGSPTQTGTTKRMEITRRAHSLHTTRWFWNSARAAPLNYGRRSQRVRRQYRRARANTTRSPDVGKRFYLEEVSASSCAFGDNSSLRDRSPHLDFMHRISAYRSM
jgi:hypothetical protein